MTTRNAVICVIALMTLCTVGMAARVNIAPILHQGEDLFVYQAYGGNSFESDTVFLGYQGTGSDVITAVPGVFSLIRNAEGAPCWANFVGAANDNSPGGAWPLGFTIKNVVLQKTTPSFVQCDEVYMPRSISQQGTKSIRTWWPLMYEAPGTIWTLTILYSTPQQRIGPNPNDVVNYDDDGSSGPNPPSPTHQETWKWKVDSTFKTLSNVLALFHELPFGLDEVPIISDENLYPVLQDKIAGIQVLIDSGNTSAAGLLLGDFELEVADAFIGSSPSQPYTTGCCVGIAQTNENPAGCKLLVDSEYLAAKYGLFISKKR